MTINHRLITAVSAVALSLPGASILGAQQPEIDELLPAQNCTYRNDPQEIELREYRARQAAASRVLQFARSAGAMAANAHNVLPGAVPRRNLVDNFIFDRLAAAGVQSAPLSTDEEFLRRVSLDLTGRAPTPAEIRAFVADQTPGKRSLAIDRLLASDGFVDKWTMWLGDLLQNAAFATNRNQRITGRNRMHEWIRESVRTDKSLRDVMYESVATSGNNFDAAAPGVNFIVRSFAPMGPAQDTYDMMLVRTATTWLGMGHYDCLLCHDGRGHLDAVSAWGTQTKRADAEKMAAFFSRTRMQGYRTDDTAHPYYGSFTVLDVRTGNYALNTDSGNRPARTPTDGLSAYNPVYRDGRAASSSAWREEFVRLAIQDKMFSRNLANRLWKAMFNLGLAEPVDLLDPLRLDPALTPPGAWTHQASHPELLEELARVLREFDFHLRPFFKLLAESSAYQLSARYEGDWNITQASLFARRIPRRLEGEEVHDAILRATGTPVPQGGYQVQDMPDRLAWAMQLPEPAEPRGRTNAAALDLMNGFQRGNRDTVQRSQSASILMMLELMNSPFITERLRAGVSPYLQALGRVSNDEAVADEMFLAFLSRSPSESERASAVAVLKSRPSRQEAIQDLAWTLINKVDFLFSY